MKTTRRVLIIEHFDPEQEVPGGIDSIIHGIVKYGASVEFSIIGITASRSRSIGTWTQINYAGREVSFLPAAFLDRRSPAGMSRLLPHSLIFLLGLFRWRKHIPAAETHVHRIETGVAASFLGCDSVIQFIHNDTGGLLAAGSDSAWRRLPALYRLLERRALRVADSSVLFNRRDAPRILEVSPETIISRTWFDPEHFGLANNGNAPFRGVLRIIWVGRLEAQKNPELAIHVIRELIERGVDAHLDLVGSGSLRNAIKKQVEMLELENRVSILGALNRPDVGRKFADSDVMLMTSRYEGSPVVLLEANSCGVPVVATYGSDPDHALDAERNGIRVEGNSVSQLSDALEIASDFVAEDCAYAARELNAEVAVPRLLQQVKIQLLGASTPWKHYFGEDSEA